MSGTSKHTLKITKESLKKVTVFNDRAELRREFTVELAAGLNEVAIESISQHVNDDSVRVTGKGAAIIEEVQVSKRRVAKGADDSERAAAIRKEKEDLDAAREKVDCEGQIVLRQSEVLDAMVAQIGKGSNAATNDKLSTTSLESITSFFAYHKKHVAQLKEEFRGLRKEFDRLTGLMAVKDHELATLSKGDFCKNVIVLLEATEEGTVVLEVTYQVGRTGWTPLYDIRVDTKEDKTEMQLSYYANVHQNTGEDWEGALLTLSTARPCVGGNIPDLGTLDVSLLRPVTFSFNSTQSSVIFGSAVSPRTGSSGLFGAAPAAASGAFGSATPAAPAPMEDRRAEVSEQTLSTEFSIARPCSIPADGVMHKVTIGIITLSPQLVHESVPSKSTAAFLTASALNSSQLPLLAGQAAVYLDGAFVAKTAIKAVSPGERFTASLGVDPAVKIEYKPARKYHEQTGLISKWSCTMREQNIIVKNTRGDALLLTFREQIPRSTDEKIQVKLLSPESVEKVNEESQLDSDEKKPKVGARLLPSNNLEWTLKLEKGETRTLLVKYSIEHPTNEKLQFSNPFF